MELIDLVNIVIIFVSQMTLLRWLTSLLGSLTVALTVLFFWIYFYLLTLVFAFLPLRNSDHVVVSVSIDFPSNSKQDVLFHIAYDCSILVLIRMVFLIIWEMFYGKISLSSVLLLLLVNFVSGFSLELMYASLIVSIRSSLTHLHGFKLLMLLP